MNYSELKAAVADWAHRSNVPTTTVDLFIDLAEAEFNNRLRCVEQETVTDLVCTGRYNDLPDDFLEMRAVEFQGTSLTPIPFDAPEYMAIRARSQPTGDPRAYSIRAGKLELMPAPSDALVTITYFAKLVPLSDAHPSNWLSESHPNLYLAESLRQMAIWTHDDAAANRYAGLVTNILGAIGSADKAKRFSGPMRVRAA